ncbi:hypothetical protein EVAR_32944_1 [Eumeta japonica]|uniref:Uncharacterized protein n=1 Tax=Eumeta variegata TaxID=151549 RepID=A0A4C1X4F1_EUMVA|nr:hypothetical protein EVAR_32944_1 [Eumeta japonica]
MPVEGARASHSLSFERITKKPALTQDLCAVEDCAVIDPPLPMSAILAYVPHVRGRNRAPVCVANGHFSMNRLRCVCFRVAAQRLGSTTTRWLNSGRGLLKTDVTNAVTASVADGAMYTPRHGACGLR